MGYIEALPAGVAENHPWQQRMRAAGLSQRVLSRMLGRPEITVSKQLRGHFKGVVPQHLTAVIVAWELMTAEQREAWVRATEEEQT